MSKNCNNCAWYCHADGFCYGKAFALGWKEYYAELVRNPERTHCPSWAFDGLEDWERTDCETLVTMETVA